MLTILIWAVCAIIVVGLVTSIYEWIKGEKPTEESPRTPDEQ